MAGQVKMRNFFDDQFNIMVEEVDAEGKVCRKLAGATNIRAARAAFDALVAAYPPERYIVLRERSRILLTAHDGKVTR